MHQLPRLPTRFGRYDLVVTIWLIIFDGVRSRYLGIWKSDVKINRSNDFGYMDSILYIADVTSLSYYFLSYQKMHTSHMIWHKCVQLFMKFTSGKFTATISTSLRILSYCSKNFFNDRRHFFMTTKERIQFWARKKSYSYMFEVMELLILKRNKSVIHIIYFITCTVF